MANLTVFEIHTCRQGAWKIDSVFDDRELAVQEAERMARTQRYSEVRAVEERFDEDTQRSVTRTIFRASKDEPSAREDRSEEALAALRKARRPPPPRKKNVVTQVISRTLLFGAIVAAGLGLIYFINSSF